MNGTYQKETNIKSGTHNVEKATVSERQINGSLLVLPNCGWVIITLLLLYEDILEN
jgi:hypothetical protein